MEGVTKFITAKGGTNAVGYLMQKEIEFLGTDIQALHVSRDGICRYYLHVNGAVNGIGECGGI